MKNLIIALSLLFTVSLSAQVKKSPAKSEAPKQVSAAKEKLSVEDAAKKDLDALTSFVTISEEKRLQFKGLFTTKHKMLASDSPEGLSAERKASISKMIEKKFESSIDKETFDKVKANKVLFLQLMN